MQSGPRTHLLAEMQNLRAADLRREAAERRNCSARRPGAHHGGDGGRLPANPWDCDHALVEGKREVQTGTETARLQDKPQQVACPNEEDTPWVSSTTDAANYTGRCTRTAQFGEVQAAGAPEFLKPLALAATAKPAMLCTPSSSHRSSPLRSRGGPPARARHVAIAGTPRRTPRSRRRRSSSRHLRPQAPHSCARSPSPRGKLGSAARASATSGIARCCGRWRPSPPPATCRRTSRSPSCTPGTNARGHRPRR
mmetsp:Transcript_14527/g.41768  ORF Transcript_14527/g.41768 Transcript_14527/m.41768 type:complete len:253 (-) Transcript_14527:1175-1933(-)